MMMMMVVVVVVVMMAVMMRMRMIMRMKMMMRRRMVVMMMVMMLMIEIQIWVGLFWCDGCSYFDFAWSWVLGHVTACHSIVVLTSGHLFCSDFSNSKQLFTPDRILAIRDPPEVDHKPQTSRGYFEVAENEAATIGA